MKWLVALVVCAFAACTLLDTAPPDDTCSTDTDCFRAQGEYCNQNTHKCEVRDGGVDTP